MKLIKGFALVILAVMAIAIGYGVLASNGAGYWYQIMGKVTQS